MPMHINIAIVHNTNNFIDCLYTNPVLEISSVLFTAYHLNVYLRFTLVVYVL